MIKFFLCFGFGLILGLLIKKRKYNYIVEKMFHGLGYLLISLMGFQITSSEELKSSMISDIVISISISITAILGSVLFVFIILFILRKNLISKESGISTGVKDQRSGSDCKNLFRILILNAGVLLLGCAMGIILIHTGMRIVLSRIMNNVLLIFIVLAGFQSGTEFLKSFHRQGKRKGRLINPAYIKLFILLPPAVILGSLLSSALVGPLFNMTWKEGMLAASPLGWQTMGGPLIMKLYGARMGSIAFITNMFRDIFSLILIPLAGKSKYKLLALAPGGVSTMDILLLSTINSIGKNNIILAMWIGGSCALWAPILIYLIK